MCALRPRKGGFWRQYVPFKHDLVVSLFVVCGIIDRSSSRRRGDRVRRQEGKKTEDDEQEDDDMSMICLGENVRHAHSRKGRDFRARWKRHGAALYGRIASGMYGDESKIR